MLSPVGSFGEDKVAPSSEDAGEGADGVKPGTPCKVIEVMAGDGDGTAVAAQQIPDSQVLVLSADGEEDNAAHGPGGPLQGGLLNRAAELADLDLNASLGSNAVSQRRQLVWSELTNALPPPKPTTHKQLPTRRAAPGTRQWRQAA